MKFINGEPNEVMQLALSMMVFATCGEDEEILKDAEIEQLESDLFHVEHNVGDPFDGVAFTVRIKREAYANGQSSVFHYNVLSSAYGDPGEFTLAIK